MADKFESYASGLSSPGSGAAAITPSDTVDLPVSARAVYIGSSGNVAVITVGGDEVTFVNTAAGSTLPVRVARVKATGTTSTNLVAIY